MVNGQGVLALMLLKNLCHQGTDVNLDSRNMVSPSSLIFLHESFEHAHEFALSVVHTVVSGLG